MKRPFAKKIAKNVNFGKNVKKIKIGLAKMCKEVYNIIRRISLIFQKMFLRRYPTLKKDIGINGLEAYYRKKRILRISAAISALISAVLFGIALIKDFTPKNELFEYGSHLFTIAAAFTFVSCITIFALCFILIPKSETFEPNFPKENEHKAYYSSDEPETVTARVLTALGIFGYACVRLYLLFSGSASAPTSLPITVLAIFLAFPYALYFVPELTDRLFSNEKAHLVCGCFGVAWFICDVIEQYFERDYVLSSPYRLAEQLLLLMLMLFTVYEIKMRTEGRAPRLYLAFLCSTFVFCFGFTAARCTMLICAKFVSVENTAMIVFEFTFMLYLAIRLFHYNED